MADVSILPVAGADRSPAQRLGSAMQVARLARGMTLAEVAAKVGVSAQFISACEQGRKVPRSSTLVAIKRALDVSLDYLMTTELVTVQTACARELDRVMEVERVIEIECQERRKAEPAGD